MISADDTRNLVSNSVKEKTLKEYLPKIEDTITKAAKRGESSAVIQYKYDSDEGLLIRDELKKAGFKCESYRTSFDYYEQFTDNYIKVSW